jgi:glyoxylase-like metal-dependent hydrolase (beta-lactamase superfamily II)
MNVSWKKIAGNSKLGDIVPLANNLWLIVGDGPKDFPNVVVYRAGDRMYVMDSGAGSGIKASILKVMQEAGPLQTFTLLNSHGHADHVGNNDVINMAQATEKHHYFSKAGLALLDPVPYFTDLFLRLSAYYDPLAAYQVDRLKWQFLKLIRDTVALFVGEKTAIAAVWSIYIKNFQPFHPSQKTMEFYESLPRQTITIGGVQWTGWVLGANDVWILEERAHTSDEVLFYLPEHKLLFTADLTFPMFPTFPDTNGRLTREMLQRCYDMASAGVVSLLINSHFLSPAVYRGQDETVSFLGTLLTEHDRFQVVLREILEEHDGLTVGEIYSYIRQRSNDTVIQHYLAMEYPDHPMSLQQIIAVNLTQMGYEAQGPKRKQRFYRPANPRYKRKRRLSSKPIAH